MNVSSYFSILFFHIIALSGKIRPAITACILPENGGYAYLELEETPMKYVNGYEEYENNDRMNVYGDETNPNYVNYDYEEYADLGNKYDKDFNTPGNLDDVNADLQQANSVSTQTLNPPNSSPIIPIRIAPEKNSLC